MYGKKACLIGTIRLFIWIVTLASVTSFIPSIKYNYWLLEINANLAGYYLFAHIFAAVFLLFILNLKKLFIIQLFLIAANAYPVYPYYFFQPEAKKESRQLSAQKIRLLYLNLKDGRQNQITVKNLIVEQTADIVALVQMDNFWKARLELEEIYPHFYEVLREDEFGLGVYSKLAFNQNVLENLGEGLPPVFVNELKVDENRSISFALLHALPPLSSNALEMNTLLLRRLSPLVRFHAQPVIVAGDFNAGPFSSFYKKFKEWTDMENIFYGFGLFRTWDARYFFLRFSIDHIFYKNLSVIKAERLKNSGLAHYPLILDIGM